MACPDCAKLSTVIADLRRELELRDEAHMRHHDLEEKALELSRSVLDTRLESMNEFREQMKDQTAEFITRNEINTSRDLFDQRLTTIESKANNLEGRMWAAGAVVTLVVAAVGLAIAFIR